MTTEKKVSRILTCVGVIFRRDFTSGARLSTPNLDFVLERKFTFHERMKGVPMNNAFSKAVGDHVPGVKPTYRT